MSQRDKTNPAAIAGQHMIVENSSGFVVADRLSNDLRRKLATRDDIAMTLATLDGNGNVTMRHAISVAGKSLDVLDIGIAQRAGRLRFLPEVNLDKDGKVIGATDISQLGITPPSPTDGSANGAAKVKKT